MAEDLDVLVLTYNHEQYISQCLNSIVEQTLRPTRIIVFDDCSTDDTWGHIENIANKHPRLFTIFRQPCNVGPAKNFNALLSQVKGRFYSVIEGDDWWTVKKLAREYAALTDNNAGLAFSNVAACDAVGRVCSVWHMAAPLPSGNLLFQVATRTVFNSSQSCCRNYLLDRLKVDLSASHIDESLPSKWDYDMLLRICSSTKAVGCSDIEPTVFYRRHPGGFSLRRVEGARATAAIYEKHIGLFNRMTARERLLIRIQTEVEICVDRRFLAEDVRPRYCPHNVIRRIMEDVKMASNDGLAVGDVIAARQAIGMLGTLDGRS